MVYECALRNYPERAPLDRTMTPRPPTISNDAILKAAREVFLEQGVAATTAEIARRVGCSEGSLFNRFGSKDELFRAAMHYGDEEPRWLALLQDRVGVADVRETMELMILSGIEFFTRLLPVSMMLWSAPQHEPWGGRPNSPPVRGLKKLTAYFEAEMRLGRIQRRDPEIVARTLAGAIFQYVSFELMYGAKTELPLAATTYARGVVDLIWPGLAPDTPPGEAPRASSPG
jgi:AcrR family transcriptional regulator